MGNKKAKAKEFCDKVGKLASDYGLNVFVVTDGASFTSNANYNDCVFLHRSVQTLWEKEKGFDSNDDWTMNL